MASTPANSKGQDLNKKNSPTIAKETNNLNTPVFKRPRKENSDKIIKSSDTLYDQLQREKKNNDEIRSDL